MSPAQGTGTALASGVERLVVLSLSGVEYAVTIEEAREVLRMVAINAVPGAPRWLLGIVNLRGRVVPVIDLRVRLGVPSAAIGLSTPILIVDATAGPVGLVADAVAGMAAVSLDAIEPYGGPDAATFVRAVCRDGGRLILMADVEAICAGVAAYVPGAA